jgi:hypothetical protein
VVVHTGIFILSGNEALACIKILFFSGDAVQITSHPAGRSLRSRHGIQNQGKHLMEKMPGNKKIHTVGAIPAY